MPAEGSRHDNNQACEGAAPRANAYTTTSVAAAICTDARRLTHTSGGYISAGAFATAESIQNGAYRTLSR